MRLSNLNLYLFLLSIIGLLFIGPGLDVLNIFFQSFGAYLNNVIELGFHLEAFNQGDWQQSWTIFYWSWWLAWSPFIGMFIARISKGFTVRELIFGVLLIPSVISFLWISGFAGSAFYNELVQTSDIMGTDLNNESIGIMEMLSFYPLGTITSIFSIILMITLFVTSSYSASLVVDHLTSGGKKGVPRAQRIFWAILEGAIASVILLGGNITVLRVAFITTGLIFSLFLTVMCYSIYIGLNTEYIILQSKEFRERVQSIADQKEGDESRTGEFSLDLSEDESFSDT